MKDTRICRLVLLTVLLGIVAVTISYSGRGRGSVLAPSANAQRERKHVSQDKELEITNSIKERINPVVSQTVLPGPAKRRTHISVRVRDLFGKSVVAANVRIGFGADMWNHTPLFTTTDQEGIASREVGYDPEINQAGIRVQCGDALIKIPRREGKVEIEFPSVNSNFGEVDIQPPGWHGAGIRLQGTKHWAGADATDADFGQRFLFVTTGDYEITDNNSGDAVIGRIQVTAHQRSTFRIQARSALRVAVTAVPQADNPTGRALFTIRGVTQQASYPEGCEFAVYGPDTRSFYGLEPGLYEIVSVSGRVLRSIELRGGEISAVSLRLDRDD